MHAKYHAIVSIIRKENAVWESFDVGATQRTIYFWK